MTNLKNFRELIYTQHDIVCNQKYGDNLLYSFHLKAVEAQGLKFIHLVKDELITNPHNVRSIDVTTHTIVKAALVGHDVIEDGRFTYNNVVEKVELGNHVANVMVADIIYCVTDEKGKGRSGRKNEKYFSELTENELAIFVKLADLAANTLFSKLTGSRMYDQYKIEFPHFVEQCYVEKFKDFFDYVGSL